MWTATYTPFGGVHTQTGNLPANRFPGQWFQSESGLHQNWMRDYDPTTGRYIQPDPLGLVDGASVYEYVKGNPGRWIDPRGLQTASIAVGGAIAGDVAIPDPSDALWPKWAGYAVAMAISHAIDWCFSCAACSPYPVGTLGYQGPETHTRGIDAGKPHYHVFIVEQIPSTCKCIWREATKRITGNHHSYVPVGAVDLTGRGRPPPYP